MGKEQKVVIITGASQGIGADLVKGYRDRNYRVVANSRSIKPSSDPDVLAVAGDVSDPATAQKIVSQALERFGRINSLVNNAGIFIAKPFTELYRGGFRVGHCNQSWKLLPPHQARRGRDAEAGFGSHRADHDQPGRSRQQQRSLGAGLADQGRIERRHQIAGDRVRKAGHPRQRGLARASSRPRCTHLKRTNSWPICIRSGAWAKPSDIVDAVLFLEGAAFVTGEILHVDGGQSAGH